MRLPPAILPFWRAMDTRFFGGLQESVWVTDRGTDANVPRCAVTRFSTWIQAEPDEEFVETLPRRIRSQRRKVALPLGAF